MRRKPEEWLSEIDMALEYRKEFGREKSWSRLERCYMHDPNSPTAIGPNLIYSHGDALLSSLTVPDPEILVSAESRFGVDKAPILERLDNRLIRKLRLKKQVERALLSCFLYGKAIIKIGYDSMFGYNPYYDVGTREAFYGLTTTMFSKKGSRLEFGSQRPGWPWFSAVRPHDFVVPWGTLDIEDAPWCAYRFVRNVDHMKNDPKYKNTTNLKPVMSMEDFMNSYTNVGAVRLKYHNKGSATYYMTKEPQYREFWEIRDAETGKIYVVTRDFDKYLRDDPDVIQAAVGGLPYVCGDFIAHPRAFWTTPLAYYLYQIQKTQFDVSLQQEKQRRINVLKFLVRADVLSQEKLTRIMSGDVGAYEEVDLNTGQSLAEVIHNLPQTQDMQFQIQSESNRRDARDMIGQSRNQLGEYDSSSRRTAREATFVFQGSEQRSSKRSQTIGQLYMDSTAMANREIFNFWQMPRDVLTENGWQNVTGADLASDYAYDLSLTTKRHLSKAERMVEAFEVLMRFAGFPGMDLQKLYQNLAQASNDPAFERLLPSPGSNQGGRSPSGGMPTIPGTA